MRNWLPYLPIRPSWSRWVHAGRFAAAGTGERSAGYEDGNYSVPARHMEGNEEVRAAPIREAREEIGIELKLDDLAVVGVVHSRSDSERVSFFVLVEHWRGEVRNMEPHKCDDLAWFEPNALPPNIVPLVRRALENLLAGRFYDSMGWDEPA